MGYTHYWYRHDHAPMSDHTRTRSHKAYANLSHDAMRICVRAIKNDIAIADGNGEGFPEFSEHYFSLNGTSVYDLWHETFTWHALPIIPEWQTHDMELHNGKQGVFYCCKTARKPYDAVVTAILLRALDHYTDDYGLLLTVSSDGNWDEWQSGRDLYKQVFGTEPSRPDSI
jgi:hypothetical protein